MRSPLRRSLMRAPVLPLLGALALVAAGCGQAAHEAAGGGGAAGGTTPTMSGGPVQAMVGGCATASSAVSKAPALAKVGDFLGPGPAVLRLTSAAKCRGYLVAQAGSSTASLALHLDGQLEPRTARPVTLAPAGGGSGFAVMASTPRGGEQWHVYVARAGSISELTARGGPVVPFVATDSVASHVSTTCTKHGLAVTEALASGGSGWDVSRRVFGIRGGRVARVDQVLLGRHVSSDALRQRYPELVRGTMFSGC